MKEHNLFWLRRWKDMMSRITVVKRHKNNPEIELDRYDY